VIQPVKDPDNKYRKRNVIIVHETDGDLLRYYEYLIGRKAGFVYPDLHPNGRSNRILYRSLRNIVAILDGNEFYRFSDVYKGCAVPVKGLKDNRASYPESILLAFLDHPGVFELSESRRRYVLYKLVISMTHPPDIWGDEDSLIVHYRAGDITDSVRTTVRKINFYLDNQRCIRRVVLVTALNYGVRSEGPSVYRHPNEIHRFQRTPESQLNGYISIRWICDQLKLPVLIYSHLNPDIDIAVLVRARHLVVSVGGFSDLVKQLNQIHLESPG
jgi:hypothetical protein